MEAKESKYFHSSTFVYKVSVPRDGYWSKPRGVRTWEPVTFGLLEGLLWFSNRQQRNWILSKCLIQSKAVSQLRPLLVQHALTSVQTWSVPMAFKGKLSSVVSRWGYSYWKGASLRCFPCFFWRRHSCTFSFNSHGNQAPNPDPEILPSFSAIAKINFTHWPQQLDFYKYWIKIATIQKNM